MRKPRHSGYQLRYVTLHCLLHGERNILNNKEN
ncbi:hypothetical protein CCP4SC76_390016 [Gammaproteobacteria bacterium]